MSSYYNPFLLPIFNKNSFKHDSLLPFNTVPSLFPPKNIVIQNFYNSPLITFFANNTAIGSLSTTALTLQKLNVNGIYFDGGGLYTSTRYQVVRRTTDIGDKIGFKMNTAAIEDGLYFGSNSISSTIGDLNISRLLFRFAGSPIDEIKNPNGSLKINQHGFQFGGPNTGDELNAAQVSSGIHRANYMNIVGASLGNLSTTRRVAFIANNVEIVNNGKIRIGAVSNISLGSQYSSDITTTYNITTTGANYTFPFPVGYTYSTTDVIELLVMHNNASFPIVSSIASVSASSVVFFIYAISGNRSVTFRLHVTKYY